MLDNLTLLAVIIIAVWVLTLGYYFYLSRQQKDIRQELDELRQMLEKQEEREGE